MKVIVNLYHIKSTNGLYYYALDYIKQLDGRILKILVRPKLYEHIINTFPALTVKICSWVSLVRELFSTDETNMLIYTPTPHPMPFLNNQLIVMHDFYPFNYGKYSTLKKLLLKISLASSNCRVAYINKSEMLPSILSMGIEEKRCLFAPNKFPSKLDIKTRSNYKRGAILKVALVGTDSPKKNYGELFHMIVDYNVTDKFIFYIYGHENKYYHDLYADFKSINISIINSDTVKLEQFFINIDILVSVANHEGFGRPIAVALLLGVPCFLLERKVFKEFFDPGAIFYETVSGMVLEMISYTTKELPEVNFLPSSEYIMAYENALAVLSQN